VFIIRAFRGVDISVVSPFRYFGVVWGLVLSYAIWSDTPNPLAVAGMVLIVASGLYTMHRETQRFRQAA
jgi:drug/metabolite transporter (DMT)-like permease